MFIEVRVLTDMYKSPKQEGGEAILIGKNLTFKAIVDTNDIKTVEQLLKSNKKPMKGKYLLHHSTKGDMVIKGCYSKMRELIMYARDGVGRKQSIGFNYSNRR